MENETSLQERGNTVSKKQFFEQVLNTFETNAGPLPSSLEAQFQQVKRILQERSDEEIEQETITAVTQPASEQQINPEKISYLLYKAFPEMERIARTAEENQYELLQATNELRGELGLATDPPSPE